jgi:transcriptional antiterminator NusG
MMTDEPTTATVEAPEASDDPPHEASHPVPPEGTEGYNPDSVPPETPPEVPEATPSSETPPDEVPPSEPPLVAGETPPAPEPSKKHWYVVKVQSGREDSIRNALERRIKIDSLEEFVGRILIPTEKVVEMVRGKRVTKKRKKFPGYLMVEVEFNDKILFLFRETSGVGDFVGGSLNRIPAPMGAREVERMLADEDDGATAKDGKTKTDNPKIVVKVQKGDRVKVQSGTFAGMEGEVKEVMYAADPKEAPRVKVEVNIWGRPVSMDIEYFYVDLVE